MTATVGRLRAKCPSCGALLLPEPGIEVPLYQPWHLRGFPALRDYVASLPEETHEWVLALYVNAELDLLSVETIARGSISGATINIGYLMSRGRKLEAAGYVLVHNHPSGDPTPSRDDINITRRLIDVSEACGLPLLCHAVVAKGGIKRVGNW